jgi:hypothetical protein
MGTLGTVGRIALGLGAGVLGALTGVKLLDDRHVKGIWHTLEESGGSGGLFTEEMVSALPDPARRYFLHAIHPGTPLASRLHWSYSGSMKPGKEMPWMSLTAEQILTKNRGFVWKARAWKGPLILTAADHYLDGDGRMRISLFGLIPVVNATGPDLSKSALARLLVEGVALPSSLLPGPHVRIEGVDESRFTVKVNLHGETTPITLTVDPDGRLKQVVMERWGNVTADGSYRYIPYGGIVEEERTFGGYTIPTRIAIGWWYGTEQYLEAIRLQVDWARLW